MSVRLKHLFPQPLVAAVLVALAAVALVGVWLGPSSQEVFRHTILNFLQAIFLASTIVLAYHYPIHVRHRTKLSMTTTPLYLIAIVLPSPLAALAAGAGVLAGEILEQRNVQTLPSDIATAAARWVLVVLFTSAITAVLAAGGAAPMIILVAAAFAMFAGDMITSALVIAPMSGEPPLWVVLNVIRETGLVEAVQYFLGILGAIAALQEPWTPALLIIPTWLVYTAFRNTKEMQDGTRKTLESMADAVDLRDPYTGGHSRRVTEYCAGILRELTIVGPEADLILSAARVHDIGKIGIPDDILKKSGRLTSTEWEIMQSHSARGAELLARYPDFARGMSIVRHHHERWDGNGYPGRLKEIKIPLGARIVAVADGFDAMTSDRPYRHAMTVQQAAAILRRESGRQWDPAIVDAFLRSMEQERKHLSEFRLEHTALPLDLEPVAVTV